MFSFHSEQHIPLSEDFSGYSSTTPESSVQLSGTSDTPNAHGEIGTPNHYGANFDHITIQSPFDPSVLDQQSFNLGQGFSSTLQNPITTRPYNSKVSKFQKKTSRTKPCTGCRRRKTKCTVPPHTTICLECSKRNMDCVFETGSEDTMKAKPTVRLCDNCHHRKTVCVIPNGSSACTECTSRYLPCKFSNSSNTNIKIRTTVPIRDYDQYQGPTIMKKTLSLQGPKSSKFLGPSSSFDKNLLVFNEVPESTSTSVGNSPSDVLNREQVQLDSGTKLRKIDDDVIFKIVNDNEEFINLSYAQVDEIEKLVYPHGLTLLNLYFRQVHPLLPVISKGVFFEKYARTHREFDPLLLCMVYLHAINFWSTDPKLAHLPKPSVEKLERLVLVLYSENLINLPPKFSTCQGLILLLHYSFTEAENDLFKPDDYWKKMSQLITICEELGLNYNSDDWVTIPSWERKVRKILTWTVILMDKMYALMEFRPSRVNPDNWLLNELRSEDFQMEENEEVFVERLDGEKYILNHKRGRPSDPVETEMTLFGNLIFVKMVHLSYYVNDALSELFNLKSLKFDDFDTILAKGTSMLTSLSKWYSSLPTQIKDIRIIAGTISTVSLNLSYYLLRFVIFRRILDSFIDADTLTDEQYTNFKSTFKHINLTITQFFESTFMSKLTQDHFRACFFYSDTANAFINIAIVHQLLLKISKEELYLDDEYTYEHTRSQYQTYINTLSSFAPHSKAVVHALDKIKTFASYD
ncbi:Transcriptional activator protein DAL81 [Cyberlindnera fabianii]|uniref:Transcriptional activator protein DAL81 n=1 Tax=Cyberlindnera fabianii TaxID=36022 RepID=A0A1V2L333_CYBFA|nr:Transcriptional activator protein DAL81 [Cyberlindnera fabianii]